jgi:hypothetical protein
LGGLSGRIVVGFGDVNPSLRHPLQDFAIFGLLGLTRPSRTIACPLPVFSSRTHLSSLCRKFHTVHSCIQCACLWQVPHESAAKAIAPSRHNLFAISLATLWRCVPDFNRATDTAKSRTGRPAFSCRQQKAPEGRQGFLTAEGQLGAEAEGPIARRINAHFSSPTLPIVRSCCLKSRRISSRTVARRRRPAAGHAMFKSEIVQCPHLIGRKHNLQSNDPRATRLSVVVRHCGTCLRPLSQLPIAQAESPMRHDAGAGERPCSLRVFQRNQNAIGSASGWCGVRPAYPLSIWP